MKALELIKSRRTIRQFKAEAIPAQVMEDIFTAAVWTPSHRNSQPWEFSVIGPQTRARLLELYRNTMTKVMADNPDLPEPARKNMENLMQDFGGAPTLVAVLSQPPQDPLQQFENPVTVGALIQNMMLAAWDQGIGCVWLSIGAAPPAREILQVKEGYQVVGVLAMGYPEVIPPVAPPREPAAARITNLP